MLKPPGRKLIEDWATQVNAVWDLAEAARVEMVKHRIATGLKLLEAKEDLEYGNFRKAFFGPNGERRLLRFGQNLAERLMAIAKRFEQADSELLQNLPSSILPLYHLAMAKHLSDDELRRLIERGEIGEDMTEEDVKCLVESQPMPAKSNGDGDLTKKIFEAIKCLHDGTSKVANADLALGLINADPFGNPAEQAVECLRELPDRLRKLRREIERLLAEAANV